MAGRGPAPKDRDRRARRNVDPTPRTLIPSNPTPQPALPGGTEHWPPRTREWWATWGTVEREPSEWEFLLETALLHARFWSGELGLAGELRLRVAKFGATPEDRQRLRYEFGDEPAPPSGPKRKMSERYADLRVLPGGADDAVEA